MCELGKEVLGKVMPALAGEGFGAAVAMSPENTAYLGGFLVPSMRIIRGRLVMCVVTPSDTCQVVADMEESYTRASTALARVRAYNEFTETPMRALADELRQMGLAGGRVGLEMDFIPAEAFQELVALLPATKFVDAGPFFLKMRAVKTPAEIEILRTLGRAAAGAHAVIAAGAHAGQTEKDISLMLIDYLLRHGADDIRQLVIGAGDRSTYANPYATERRLEKGDVMRVDIYGQLRNYLSDCARTYVVGEATLARRETWQRMLEVRRACLAMIKPGARTADIYRLFHDKFTAWGYRPINFLGHGLGLTLHEDPYIGRYGDWVLEAGQVLCVEPYVVFPAEKCGFQVEDEVLVTAQGYELLTGGEAEPDLPVLR
jgi:Xaa-Pro dipeptidase